MIFSQLIVKMSKDQLKIFRIFILSENRIDRVEARNVCQLIDWTILRKDALIPILLANVFEWIINFGEWKKNNTKLIFSDSFDFYYLIWSTRMGGVMCYDNNHEGKTSKKTVTAVRETDQDHQTKLMYTPTYYTNPERKDEDFTFNDKLRLQSVNKISDGNPSSYKN